MTTHQTSRAGAILFFASLLLVGCDAAEVETTPGDAGVSEAGCVTSSCISPPPPTCVDAVSIRIYKESGTCDAVTQTCVYEWTEQVCPGGCKDGKCLGDLCIGVTCNTPPPPACANPLALNTYTAPGLCKDGTCEYPYTEQSCPNGCKDGKCLTDPCAAITCTTPDPPKCLDATTLRTYSSPGTCKDKQCSYPHQDQTCPNGCDNGACKPIPGLVPLAPFRFLDTRGGAVPASGSTKCVTIAGKAGIPTTAKAVAVNLVAVTPSGDGHLIAYPKGIAQPNVSTLNYATGDTIANGAIVELGSGGEICVYVHTATHIIVDVSGYFPDGSSYFPVTPYRRLDTRSGAKPASGATKCIQIAGVNSIPASAKAVAVNLVAIGANGAGFFIAYPKGASKPATSNLNYAAGQTIANGAIVEVGNGGEICVYVHTAAHIIVDVSGYFDTDASYTPVTPLREVDTRSGAMPASGSTKCYQIAGVSGIPGTAQAVAINITAASPSAGGHLIVYPDGQTQPGTSTLNYPSGQSRANNALVQPGSGGRICVYTLAATHHIIDVVGYWPAQTAGDPCAGVTCTSPPPKTCVGGTSLVSYSSPGTCVGGTCTYPMTTTACPAWCSGKACQPVFGWDYNLNHRCVTSPRPTNPNFFSDTTDCPTPGKHWMVSVNAERSLGQQCTGVQDQALPINSGGPLTFSWQPHTDEFGRANWIANIKTDLMSQAHPCGADVYTFYGFADFVYFGGGPFPTPDKVFHRVNVKYDDWTPNGASRAIAFFAGEWNGKGVWLEIDLSSANWGDAYPSVSDIVQVYKSSSFLWVEMYGPAMGYTIPKKAFTKLVINWTSIIKDLISRGYLEAPAGGLSAAKTVGLGLATEARNIGKTGVSAEMWITDFRVMDQ
jgi:hypothetical protein